MPAQRQEKSNQSYQHCKGGKENADLCRLTRSNHIRGQALEYSLKFTGTCSNIILSTSQTCDLGECLFIDLPAKAPAATTSTKGIVAKRRAKPKPSTKWIIIPTVHG